jgi:multidrug efflux pump subunit AcrA (membrane-fusion protein)
MPRANRHYLPGYSSADELHTLDEVGITSINTGYTATNVTDTNGNTETMAGTYTKADGTTGEVGNMAMQRDTAYSIANEWLDVPEDVASLPDLQGSGNVYDLQQAMVRDTSGTLKSLIEQFTTTDDIPTRNSLMDQILYKWTGSDTIDPNSRGGAIDARKLTVLEKFYGQAFVGTSGSNPNANAVPLLNKSYNGLSEMFYSQLMSQTHLKGLYDEITYTWDETTQSVKGNLSGVITDIQDRITANATTGNQFLMEFTRTLSGLQAVDTIDTTAFRVVFTPQNEEVGFILDSIGKNVIRGTSGTDSLTGTANADAIAGDAGNDNISGNAGDDVLYGNAGADYLYGGDGNDVLNGGKESIEEARKNLDALQREREKGILSDIVDRERDIIALSGEAIKAKKRSELEKLPSPVDGTVHGLASYTVGGVLTPAQPTVTIVPSGTPLVIEAMALNQDIGFLRLGQEAEVKLDTFPFQKYGTIKGKVIWLSPDAVDDEKLGLVYKMKVEMERTSIAVDGKKIALSPGMSLSVEVKTNKRRIIEFFLSPIIKYATESLTLR